ncbi:MAG TPA: hypothetical protein VGM29_06725 [Polyangiaceae bacterium]|jgi:hypothetical protein
MYGQESREEIVDGEQLRLLRIGYFLSAGYSAVFIPIGIVYGVMFAFVMRLPTKGPPPPAFLPWVFGAMGLVFALFAAFSVTLKLLAAKRLRERRGRTLCFVAAALAVLEVPYGSALGIFTFIVLSRANVIRAFEARSAAEE